jgi:hypothetical protein
VVAAATSDTSDEGRSVTAVTAEPLVLRAYKLAAP